MRFAMALPALALAACLQQPAEAPPVEASASAAPDEASPTAAAVPSEAATREAPEATFTANSVILVGATEGRGTATTLEFGRDKATVLEVMAFDFPKPKLSAIRECGAGPMEFADYGAFKLHFLDGKLAGWMAEARDGVVTSDGIRPGITIGDLRRERPVQILESTLDGEFEYASPDGGTIGGFAKGTGDAAVIQSLHAGVNCFFR